MTEGFLVSVASAHSTVSDDDEAVDAFDSLGHEIRLAIVCELANDRRVGWQWRGRGFADLRKAVGVHDPGRFSYHLDELRGQFVVQQDDCYHLTPTGMAVAGAVLSGTYDGERPSWREDTDYQCPECGTGLDAVYRHGYFRLSCPDHGPVSGTTLPPGVTADRSVSAVVETAVHDVNDYVTRALNGECPHCRGTTDVTLPSPDRPPAQDDPPDPPPAGDLVLVRFDCERCGLVFWTTPAQCIARHPAVSGFCWEHGVDTRGTPVETLPFGNPEAATLEREDPVRVRVDVTLDGETLRARLDGDGNVIETERLGQ